MRSTAIWHFKLGRFLFLLLSFLIFTFQTPASHADSAGPANSLPACGFAKVIHGPFTFRQVELVSRFHSIGLWRGGVATLNPWIEVSEKAFLGIDQFGRVLNVIQLEDRTVAFVLSGERKIRDIFYLAPGILLAIDTSGHLLRYSSSEWSKHNLKDFIVEAGRNLGISQCLAATGLAAFSRMADVSIVAPEVLVSFGLAAVAGVMIQGYRASAQFEAQNQITDGFEPLNMRLEGFHYAEMVRGPDGSIIDYVRGGQSLVKSLEGAPLGPPVDFDKKCEHDLLPRGIPPQNYEPSLK